MKLYSKILTGILAALILGGVVYYLRNDIVKTYNDSLQGFSKIDLGKLVDEIKKEISAPTPLNIGGLPNNVVLVKARIIAQTNLQRYDNGMLPPLLENATLDQVALAKANDMFEKQYFEHISPSGVGPGELAKSYGYSFIVEGENLILGNFKDEKEVVDLWMNSPGHRANILNDRYTEIGVAIIKGTYNGQTTWIGVQEFGLPLSNCPEPSANVKTTINANQAQLDQWSLQITAKKSEIDNTDKKSPQYNQRVEEYNQLVKSYNALVNETKSLISQYNSQVQSFNRCVEGS